MNSGFGVDIKKRIKDYAVKAIEEFSQTQKIQAEYGEPLIGYAQSMNPLFAMLDKYEFTRHPKTIYRPGNTVIVHFTPIHAEDWQEAYENSFLLSAQINRAIRSALSELGRLTSGTTTPSDWNEEMFAEEWSHKAMAFVAGLGQFTTRGGFVTESGARGCFNCVITDGFLEPSKVWSEEELSDADKIFRQIMAACKYKETPIMREYGITPVEFQVSQAAIEACPCGAISKDGVDRAACQEYCRSFGYVVPSADLCGKCYGL